MYNIFNMNDEIFLGEYPYFIILSLLLAIVREKSCQFFYYSIWKKLN